MLRHLSAPKRFGSTAGAAGLPAADWGAAAGAACAGRPNMVRTPSVRLKESRDHRSRSGSFRCMGASRGRCCSIAATLRLRMVMHPRALRVARPPAALSSACQRPRLELSMSRPKLFEPMQLGRLTLSNRIVIAPMCQYSAVEGCMTDWHVIHLGHLALSGAALLTIEATAVEPAGRISYADVGLYDAATEAAIARVLESVRRYSAIPVAIQLAHAGRKASTEVPWKGGAQIAPSATHGWQTLAPSAVPFAAGQSTPHALERADLERIREAFVAAALRAARLGIDAVQLHSAHG